MDFKTFEELFTPFCQTPHIKSGKAKSYYNAIIYLAEFLNVKKLTRDGVLSIIHKEEAIQNKASVFYSELLKWLSSHKRKSYLSNGYIRAAMPYFKEFVKQYNLL